MDKYTVDLDQVLNDFEYSELTTDQQPPPSAAAAPQPHSAKHYSSTKHSINNVFSSLNDYLSAEINENVLEYNNAEFDNKYDNKSFQSTLSMAPALPALESTAVGSILEYPSISNMHAKPAGAEGAHTVVADVTMTPVKEWPLETLITHPILLKIQDTENESIDGPLQQDIETILKVNEAINVLISEEEKVDVDETEDISNSTEEEVILVPTNHQNNRMDVVEEDKDVVDVAEIVDIAVAEVTQTTTKDNDIVQEEEKVETDVNSNLHVIEAETQSKTEIEPEPEPEAETETVTVNEIEIETHCDKIGFHMEVADEEAARYLADLDLEDGDDEETFHDVPSPSEQAPRLPDAEKMRVEAAVEAPRFKIAEAFETPRPNSLDIKDLKEEPVNLIGNPGSTPYNNVYASKEMPCDDQEQPAEAKHNEDGEYESECSTSVSPTFSEASTESVRSAGDGELQAENAALTLEGQGQQTEKMERIESGSAAMEQDLQEHQRAGEQGIGESESESITDVPCHGLNESGISEEEVYVDVDSITGDVPVRDAEAAGADADAETVGVPVPVSETENVHEHEHDDEDAMWLGKRAPVWIPDADALCCQHCELKFTVIKRRHHCRACGLVLCSKCCGMKHKLEYLSAEARVCTRCYDVLSHGEDSGSGDSQHSTPNREDAGAAGSGSQPNPNNPMEYCSVVPPHQQVRAGSSAPSVMVPVGVLKRKGSNKKHNKSVMFCDGIRPGSDLTNLDQDFNYNDARKAQSAASSTTPTPPITKKSQPAVKLNKNLPTVDPVTQSFIPENENCLPPTVTTYKSDITYTECGNNANVVETLKSETLTFAVQRNLHIHLRLITLDCCVNKQAWCFSTEGLIAVGQDEIVILLEYIENEAQVPKDVFLHLNNIYNSAVKGTTVRELGLSIHLTTNFLDSRNHAGFIFVRPTFQCLLNVIIPKEPYLVGVLVHRWETPWARIFPLRLVLRLGAEYRYYPAPLISTRHRDSVFVEIGHTIINLLADFRNFSYTLPKIRGLTIHMEEKSTTVSIPVNRYDQVMKSMSNSSEHILAFGGNFSAEADSHLVCIQDTQGSNENSYKTHAINIQNKPRKVTGASFIVFNGALKSSSGLTAKSSIVEDGLMIQIPPEHMVKVRDSLRNMRNHTIQCGCVNAASDETVNIVWTADDVNFNIGVKSSVDGRSLAGVPSIRVHNGKDYTCNSGARLVRWTEVFLLQNGEENARTQDPVDISKVAESISKATCQALVKYLDLLATNSFMKIGIRTTLHVDDVSYSAGSNGQKLPPIYMKSLDNELVPVLHRITSAGNVGDGTIVLELIFRILNV